METAADQFFETRLMVVAALLRAGRDRRGSIEGGGRMPIVSTQDECATEHVLRLDTRHVLSIQTERWS
jgi:hypothetical protein